jgi:hypothetical protein
MSSKAEVGFRESGTHQGPRTLFSATKGFWWIMALSAFWMGALFGFYEITDKILGR